VTTEIERSIERGIRYLVQTQNHDGSWRGSGGYGSYPCAMSSLAGTALLMNGSTSTRGPVAKNIRRCRDFLLSLSQPSGLITAPWEESRSMHGHGFAMLFLAQVFGMEEDAREQQKLHQKLSRAIELIARSQSRAGGWLYAPDSGGDEGSVTVTQVQGLRACRNAGILVPKETIDRAIKYIANSQNSDGGIRYQAGGGGPSRPAITAAAVAVLYNAGNYDDPMAAKALAYARKTVTVTGGGGGHYFYSHLYLAEALYQAGGEPWDEYYKSMSGRLLKMQKTDGSWDGDGVGTTYGTAIALTILQLPYAYLPIFQR
jgi:squalene cyclase